MAEAADRARPRRHRVRMRLRLISAVTLVFLVGAAVASSLVVRNLIQDQERLLLQERAGEAASVLGSTFAGVQDSLHLLGTIAMAGQGRPSVFAAASQASAMVALA